MVGLRLRPGFIGDIHKVGQVSWPGTFVIRFFGDDSHKITHVAFIGRPVLDGDLTEGEACVSPIDRVHDPASDFRRREVGTGSGRKCGRNRTTRYTRAQGRGQEFFSVDDLHDAVITGAVREIDAVTLDSCRYRTMYGGYLGEVWRYHTARLLSIKSPVSEEFGIRRVA